MKNEVVYKFLDDNIKKYREKTLEEFLRGNMDSFEQLKFYDLDMYNNSNTIKDDIRRRIYQSKINNKIILTKYQIEILDILQNNNLFLSAPTSFGKTFIMLEFIKRNYDKLN